MEDTTPDFQPLTERQKDLLEDIKFYKKEIQNELKQLPRRPLGNLDPKEIELYFKGPEFSRLRILNKELDNLTVKAIRSLWRRIPGKKGYPRICMIYKKDARGRLQSFNSFVPGEGIEYHPELPRWALEHMCRWVHDKRWIRSDKNYDLLADCKMGFETGLQKPLNYDVLERVLRARGFDMHSGKNLKKIQKKDGKNKSKLRRPKKRVRKVSNSWDQIALELAELTRNGSIPTTGEGLKIMLQKMFPDVDFDRV